MDLYSDRRHHRINFEIEDMLKTRMRMSCKIAFIEEIGTVHLLNEDDLRCSVC